MQLITKYGIGLLIIISLLFKARFIVPSSITINLFNLMMGLGLLISFIKVPVLFTKSSFKTFWVLYFINALNIIYFIFFDSRNVESLFYLATKIIFSNLIILGILYNHDFYKNFYEKYFKYVMMIMLVLGYFFGDQESFSGRLSLGFNANDLGYFSLFGISSILIMDSTKIKSFTNLLLLGVFFFSAIASGSKAVLVGLTFIILLNFRFKLQSLALISIVIIVFQLLQSFNFTTSLDRFLSTNSGFNFNNRDEVFNAGYQTFKDSFYFGHGLNKYGWADPKYFYGIALGPHNTYLSIGIMYGIIFGSFFLIAVLRSVWQTKNLLKVNNYNKFMVTITLLTLMLGFSETLITGVNEFISVFFWFALANNLYITKRKDYINA